MAFDPDNWGVISDSGSLGGDTLQNGTVVGAPALYTYQSLTETQATIAAANYFSPVAHTLSPNDLLEVVASDGFQDYTIATVNYETLGVTITANTGTGDVNGPGSSTDRAVVRWNGLSGKIIQNSTVILSDTGDFTAVNSIANASGLVATPSYTFTGDLDTGMWRSAANTLDFSTNALRGFQIDASPAVAVDYLSVKSAATSTIGLPLLQAKGTDTNIDVGVLPKGTGGLSVRGATNAGSIKLWNAANTFYAQISAGVMASNINWVWPIVDGAAGQSIVTDGAGVLSFANSQKETWIDQTTTPVTMVVNSSYVADNAGLVTFNMPATAAFGDIFEIAGKGAGGWLVQAAGGQTINMGSSPTSVAGSLASTNRYDCIKILCVTANTTFVVTQSMGNITVA
jgi:hypothetical protein